MTREEQIKIINEVGRHLMSAVFALSKLITNEEAEEELLRRQQEEGKVYSA